MYIFGASKSLLDWVVRQSLAQIACFGDKLEQAILTPALSRFLGPLQINSVSIPKPLSYVVWTITHIRSTLFSSYRTNSVVSRMH
jgi:hypothetical protein